MFVSNLFRKLSPKGIQTQLILGIASIQIVLMSLFIMAMVNQQQNFFLKQNHDRALGLSTNLANTSNSYVISLELAGLQKLVETYKNIPNIKYAFVTSSDGVVLAHSDEKYRGQKASDSISTKLKPINATQTLIENDKVLDIATPIINHNEIAGWARIGLSQEFIEPNLRAIRIRGTLFILLSLFISSIFAIIVARGLTKGLQNLITAAEKIKGGKRDLRVGLSRSIEISQLGTAFNQMLDDISSNEKLLGMVLESLPVGVFILDEKGDILSGNPAGQEMWKGVKYVGKDEYNLYRGWFTETGKELQNSDWGASIVLAEGRPVFNQEIEIECFDKSHKIILNSAIPLRDANEKIIGVITINVDITERKNAENELRTRNHDIGERVKELRCLYRLSQLSNDPDKTMQSILQECADIIPPSYQYPEIACSRIEFEEQVFESANFIETSWKQEQNIIKRNVSVGKVQVYYKKQMPEEAEGPFLKEERLLINSIADVLGSSAERKQAEEKLRESEERYKSIISVSNTGAWEYHSDTEYLWCSPEYFSMLGRDQNEFDISGSKNLQETWVDLLHPDDRDMAANHFAAYLKNDSIGQYENYFRLLHKNGNWIWIWSRGQTLRDAKGNLTNLTVGTHIDITERKNAEALIKEQGEVFSAIIENANESIWLLSPDFKVLQFNKTALNRLQLNRGKEIYTGANFHEFLHVGSEDVFIPMFNDAVAGKYPERESYQPNIHGEMYWLRTRMYPVHDAQKKLIGVTVLAENITDRKNAEINLIQSEEKNRALIENISDTIILVNENLELTYQSPSYIRTAGFTMDDHKGKTILEFIHPDDVEKCQGIFDDARFAPGLSIQDQMRLLHKNGDYIWIEGTITNLLENDSVKAFVVNYRDITERKFMEEEREKNINELLQKNRDLEQFSYTVSHNLRGPVASIMGLTGLISNDALDQQGKEKIISGIDTSVHKLDEVIKDLNNILSVKKELNENKEEVRLQELLDDVRLSIADIIKKENVKIISDFSAIQKITTLKSYLYSIFYNLISNSIKYRQPGKNSIIEIRSTISENKITLTFKDNGLGMNLSSYGEQVFGLYKRFHPQSEGKGMGLYMVKTQTEMIGGTISVNSELNEWTEFKIEFGIVND